jgi:hypothetical protein
MRVATMLRIENLHATVAGKPILNGLGLALDAGEIHLQGEGSPVQKLPGISLPGTVG